MHLVTFLHESQTRPGIYLPNKKVIADIMALPGFDIPTSMQQIIEAGEPLLTTMKQAAEEAPTLPLASVELLAPIPQPRRNIFCIGKNYRDHVKEIQHAIGGTKLDGGDAPESPIFFTKATTTVSAHGSTIPASDDPSDSTDYEGELAVVIGKSGKGISRENAAEYIFGYSILNDVTARRLQKKHQQWFLGKSLDGYCPMGPALVTADGIEDVSALELKTLVNGELRQQGKVSDMIFDIPAIIETLSSVITLLPGDIIASGTPAGVGMGFKPPKFLHPGDRVAVSIEPLGTLENLVG